MKTFHVLSPLGIRLQLMLWYSAIFTLLLLLFAGLFFSRFQTQLASSLDTALQLQAQQIAGDITDTAGTISIHDATADLPGFDPTDQGRHVPPADVNLGIMVCIVTDDGQPVRTTPAFHQLQIPKASVTQPLHGIPWQGDVTTITGQRVRLYSRALIQEGRIFGVVQVGTPLTQIQTALSDVIFQMVFIVPAMLVLAALGSYWLASLAFAPIHRVIRIAREIKAGDLRRRVPVPRAQDEVRHLAVTLNEMIDHLEQTFVRQQRFVADASHELRTPVAVIWSKTNLALLQIVSPEEYLDIFSSIRGEAERLSQLISDLLALARADEGQARLEREVVRFDQLVEAVASTTDALAAERQVGLHIQANEPVTVLGDEARLMQVVMNLLENALLYTDKGGEVFLSVYAQQTWAVLVVQDTGVGIATEHLPFLFDRFYRVDAARTHTEGSNSGLGLAIVDWVVKEHRGDVKVKSQVGKGSTFTVTLPLLTGA
jgi:heavy metal sensor kinase